jgi:anti-anti-sigma regulatory factor
MTSFTSRYGNPAVDHKGAHLWAYRRHGATVVAVRGRIDAANLNRVTDYVVRFIAADSRLVLDLSEVTGFTPRATQLINTVDKRCALVGIDWALVPGAAVVRRLRTDSGAAGLPVIDSVAEAEHQFDEAILKRRRFLVSLLGRTA